MAFGGFSWLQLAQVSHEISQINVHTYTCTQREAESTAAMEQHLTTIKNKLEAQVGMCVCVCVCVCLATIKNKLEA